MTLYDFYRDAVYPKLNLSIADKYPRVSLVPTRTHHTIAEHSILMLVALTGTGKSTTLEYITKMAAGRTSEMISVIPTRREIADWIAIPTAEALLGESIQPVQDRVQRFHYTRTFADHVAGGMARAFTWINISNDYQHLVLSEGIRGPSEIAFALEHCPGWHIVELTLKPLERLRRLSTRDDVFDHVEGTEDVAFLPDELRGEARALLEVGEITSKALTIMRVESESYGFVPFDNAAKHPNYYHIQVDDLTREQVADAVYAIINRNT